MEPKLGKTSLVNESNVTAALLQRQTYHPSNFLVDYDTGTNFKGSKRVRFSMSFPFEDMDGRDDDDGVGFVTESHYLKSPTVAEQQAMRLLQVPGRTGREGSISSNVSDLDVPIYSSENLTTSPRREVPSTKELDKKESKESNESTSTADTSSKPNDLGFNGRLAFAIAAAALGSSFQHGYNTGVLNNPQKILEQWINSTMVERGASPSQESVTLVFSLMVAIFCVGGMIGGAITGFVAERLGRKGGLLVNNILVLLSVICMSSSKAASSYELIILGRFLIGINSGLNAGLVPMYLAEISPVNLRGAVGTVYQLVITISILIAQIVSLKSLLGTADHWPTLLALTIIPAIFQVATLPFCPESPKYLLLSKGRELEAQKALSWFRGTLAVHEEMDGMRAEYDAMKMVPKVTMRELITNSALRIPLVIALTVMVAQQLSGINAIMFFSSKIFKMAGLNDENSTYATLGMGGINVLMTVVSLFLVEKAGRKTLLLIGFAGMAIDTALLTVSMVFAGTSQALGILCVIFVLVYVIMFACGPGSIPWFLVSELFNQAARPTASALAVCINWTANFLVGLAFLPLAELIGPYVFIIFVVLQTLFLLFIYKKVPETKNKSLEEISAMFRQQSYQ